MADSLQHPIAVLECDHFDLTPVKGDRTGERLDRFEVQAGELVLADAGYSNPPRNRQSDEEQMCVYV